MRRSSKKPRRRAGRSAPNAQYGALLRAWRNYRKLSLQTVSEKTGIRKPGISMMERGQQDITLSYLDRLLAALDLTWPAFLAGPPSAQPVEAAS